MPGSNQGDGSRRGPDGLRRPGFPAGGVRRARTGRDLGVEGETRAADWYVAAGCQILERNWRCAEGEIDLLCRDGRSLVVCEVKARSSERFGRPADAVVRSKQRRLRRLAARWLAQQDERFDEVRFDVATVSAGRVAVIRDAF